MKTKTKLERWSKPAANPGGTTLPVSPACHSFIAPASLVKYATPHYAASRKTVMLKHG
jgi:hypothetical protein